MTENVTPKNVTRLGVVGLLPRQVHVTLTARQVTEMQKIITEWLVIAHPSGVERDSALTIRKFLGEASRA